MSIFDAHLQNSILRVAAARSWLYVPGDRPDRFAKAAGSGADAIILDLEDAVMPARKNQARRHVADYLNGRTKGAVTVAVRMNPLNRLIGLEDMIAIAAAAEAIVLPKAEEASVLDLAGQLLHDAGKETALVALIESARGVANAGAIAESTPRLAGLMFGAADYAADLGQQVGKFRADYARAAVVNAAAFRGLAAIDSPCFRMDDPGTLEAECASAKALGFFGKAAIHPSQIARIQQEFQPTAEERNYAERILALGDGATTLDGKMVDIAMKRWAGRIMAARVF
jgi:citrate lyase beta subunit